MAWTTGTWKARIVMMSSTQSRESAACGQENLAMVYIMAAGAPRSELRAERILVLATQIAVATVPPSQLLDLPEK